MIELSKEELKDFLDSKVLQYNTFDFIEPDPISVPHRYSLKEDIEIAGFLASSIAWGNRKMITKNGHRMMDLLGNSPYDFVMSHEDYQLERLNGFVHRTFNAEDFNHFIKALKHIYTNKGGLQQIFVNNQTDTSLQPAIHALNEAFFEIPHLNRTRKHVADPNKGSVAKRINMCLRWFIRNDNMGVDLGIWDNISPSKLSCPLDVHSGNVARKLGLLTRKQNDGKALQELDNSLRLLDQNDPVKYDFALFGLGIFEGF
ncbi:TIGR02757 family protein [Flavobacterium petrolei]|uniref:TIGR02757 family protein n=1 Tax=Flavobacterium petrolei TaxID=2259594 RepID=A0A482TU30_9FLAO|nr:TIGR02757 family protein [Flavobacterium petrolei]RYJ51016.1 TIGR02757 family protein [Flavobacterium petrolei]